MNAHTISAEMSFGSAVRRSLSRYMFKSETRRPLPHMCCSHVGNVFVCVQAFYRHGCISLPLSTMSTHPKLFQETPGLVSKG